jgi:predicted Rossmann fold nucleotide-binding protein DprA/Smf involved in DNA uptake
MKGGIYTMANKKTLKDYFNELIALANENGRTDLVEFCEDRIEKLSRKGSSKKPTKNQVENDTIKETILTVLDEMGAVSATMLSTDPRIGVSSQRVTALLTQLKNDGKVVRTEDKGKVYFSLPAED